MKPLHYKILPFVSLIHESLEFCIRVNFDFIILYVYKCLFHSGYTQINSRELDYSYDDEDEGSSLHIDKYRIQQESISDLVCYFYILLMEVKKLL